MNLIEASSAKVFAMHEATFTGLASPSRGSTENSAWIVELSSNQAGVTHQLTREEIFICLSGAAKVSMGEEHYTLSAGSCLIVPAHTRFSISKTSNENFRAVAILPVGAEAMLEDGKTFIPPWAL
ncbi:MAG: cupin domain-containing protein [Burkholderiales bacterium]|nr:cupin domain-containing protein [Burkholderiales bacterium]MBI3730844.1 cupin domain-containing protein [Burkholderiales bacterium]